MNQKDHENCRIQLLVVVIFRKLKQNGKKVMMMMQYINCVSINQSIRDF